MRRRLPAVAIALFVLAPLALAEWLQPDASYRDAQFLLRQAVRDTMGRSDDPARLDTLGVALLRLARFDEARKAFGKVLAVNPNDGAALAAFGKLALFGDRASEAESLLTLAAKDPLPAASIDVVISNCVINLSADKPAVMAEMARVLRPGGRVGISDVVADDALDEAERAERGSFVGCIAGALSFGEYRRGLEAVGFRDIAVTPTHAVADGMWSAIVTAVRV